MATLQEIIDQALARARASGLGTWLQQGTAPSQEAAPEPNAVQPASYSAGEYVPDFAYTAPPAGLLDNPSGWIDQNGKGIAAVGKVGLGLMKKAKEKNQTDLQAPQPVVLQPLHRITLGKGLL